MAALAFVVRLVPVLHGGGLGSYGRYDDGVYYAAADSLTFGRVPYRDFVLLHPPVIMLVLAPFALLGRVTSDPVGMAVGRLFFMAIGALNAALVASLAYRWGRRGALIAGVLYACWLPAVYGEQTTLLEPLGGTALLVALLLLLKTERPPTPRAEMIAGAILGLAFALKIWYVVPWAVVFLWQLAIGKRWSASRILVSGTIALLVVIAPFAILARSRMYDMVIRDQLLRPVKRTSRGARIPNLLGVRPPFFASDHPAAILVTAVVIVVLAAAAVICWQQREARVLVAVLIANVAVLIAAPSYFEHYGAFTAAPIALVFGVGLNSLAPVAGLRPMPVAVIPVLLIALLGYGLNLILTPQGKVFPGSQFAAAAPPGCVMSDDPQALIQMNRLSRDLRSGCSIPVDVTGVTYGELRRTGQGGTVVARERNRAWQSYLYHYLMSGTSFVVARRKGDAMAPDIRHALDRQPALAMSHQLVLHHGTSGG